MFSTNLFFFVHLRTYLTNNKLSDRQATPEDAEKIN